MIQLHVNKDDLADIRGAGFRKHLQVTDHFFDLSPTPWHWHARQTTILGYKVWLLIEQESKFCLCFINTTQRQLKQLDLTLWMRLVSESTFMGGKTLAGSRLPIDEHFLTVVRNWAAPMELIEDATAEFDTHAQELFIKVRQFLYRPLPVPIPTYHEMEMSWSINTTPLSANTYNNDKIGFKSYMQQIKQLSQVVDFSIDHLDIHDSKLNDLIITDNFYQQFQANKSIGITPALLFTSRIASIKRQSSQINSVVSLQPN